MTKGKFATSLVDRSCTITYGIQPDEWAKTHEYYKDKNNNLKYVGTVGTIRTVLPEKDGVYFQVEIESDHTLILVKSENIQLDSHVKEDPYSYAMMKIVTGIRAAENYQGAMSDEELYVIMEIKKVIEEEDPVSLNVKGE